jgi:uncharacterized protein YegL
MNEPAGILLPIYFVADESGSMAGNIDELNAGLNSLLDALHLQSAAARKVRFSVIGFSDTVECRLSLQDLTDIEVMPFLEARGSTSYSAAFDDLCERIPRDVAKLKSEHYRVNRPSVFFLSDGLPNKDDPWEASLSRLNALREHPNILAFGIGSADPATMIKLASKSNFAFQAAAGVDTGKAIANFLEQLTHSVVSSGQAIANGSTELPFEKPEGFSLSVDVL